MKLGCFTASLQSIYIVYVSLHSKRTEVNQLQIKIRIIMPHKGGFTVDNFFEAELKNRLLNKDRVNRFGLFRHVQNFNRFSPPFLHKIVSATNYYISTIKWKYAYVQIKLMPFNFSRLINYTIFIK